MKKTIAAVVASSVATVPVLAQDEVTTYRPTGGWTADFGDDYCRLIRTFSDGENELTLGMERIQPTTLTKFMVIGDGIRLYRRATTVGLSYMPDGGKRDAFLARSETGDGTQFLIMDGVNMGPDLATLFGGGGRGPGSGQGAAGGPEFTPGTPIYFAQAEAEFAAGVRGVSLSEGLLNPVRIETGSLRSVIPVMQDCTYNLLDSWDLDGAKHRTISRTVVPIEGTTLPQGTVPFTDFGKMAGGVNQVRLMIDESGSPTSCHIHMPSLDQSTNDDICEHLMENARFEPALDAEGQPMASYWISSPTSMFSFGGT
jgi:hypothetical protein